MTPASLRILFLLISFSLFNTSGYAQSLKNFSNDPTKYLNELEGFFGESNKKEASEIIKDFSPIWNGGKLTASQQQTILDMSNGMLKKRMKAFPDFKAYVAAIIAFVNSNRDDALFKGWHVSLEKLLQGRNKDFATYMKACDDLFATNTLYQSPATHWQSTSPNFEIGYDSVPFVRFASLNLVCRSKGDSTIIFNTSGTLYPVENQFYGSKGKILWTRAGIDESIAYAELRNYSIKMTASEFTADSVQLNNKGVYAKPLLGKLQEKLMSNAGPENASYPKFDSYDINLDIKDIQKDVNYRGGFSMWGNKIIGSGNKDQDAQLYFSRNNKPFMLVGSKSFIIRPDRITSENASVTIKFENDSIYHPGLNFKYIVEAREVSMINGDNRTIIPYFDSYHQMDIYGEGLYWKIDDPLIDIKMISGAGQSQMTLESANLFNDQRFMRIQGMSTVNPLYTIKQFAEKYQTKVIYAEDLAAYMKFPVSEIKSLLITLSTQGFVTYISDEEKAIIRDRLSYYLTAKAGKTDYDIIAINSVISGQSNATLNLLNFDLKVRGVSQVQLSDSQNVFIVPTNQELVIGKNRDFTFSGRVKAGRFDIYGKDFRFDYDGFKFDLANVDSVRMKVPMGKPDENGRVALVTVKSVLQNMTGDLLIDHPLSKSGRLSGAHYPVFNSKKESFVYYDNAEIHGGVYQKDKFYFNLEPFTVDSLDELTKEGLVFQGNFVSAGIFPDIKEQLTVQNDYSLGFIRQTVPTGLATYGGKGNFAKTIKLSNEGLKGKGDLAYLSSNLVSDELFFFPDSMNASAKDFSIKKENVKGVEFPSVKAKEVYAHWEPYKDKMYVYQKKDPMQMYDGQALLTGNLVLTPSRLGGTGIVGFGQADLASNDFVFKPNNFGADTSDFKLREEGSQNLAFSTKNVKANVDLAKRIGEFKSNGGGSYVTFPVNQYICYIDEVKWLMDKKEIELTSTTQLAGKSEIGSEFVSIHPTQDSLRFFAPKAVYRLDEYIIKTEKVKQILVADAAITPDKGEIIIDKGAKIRRLQDAVVVANTSSKFHTLLNASIDIFGRKSYSGSADYTFVDEGGGKQIIKMTSVKVNDSLQTVASGLITEKESFMLNPKFKYKGTVTLTAPRKNLFFKGFAGIDPTCENVKKTWFGFDSELDPSVIAIPIANAKSESNENLYAGIYFSDDTLGVYPAFLNKISNTADNELFRATGSLRYDKTFNSYIIEPVSKDSVNNVLTLNETRCVITAEGRIGIGSGLGQVNMRSAGSISYNLNNDSSAVRMISMIDFFFSDDAFKQMSESILLLPKLEPSNDARPEFDKALRAIVEKESADKYVQEMSLYGAIKKLPSDMQASLFLTDVSLTWDARRKAFVSGGPISVGMINKIPVNRKLGGQIELQKKRSGDVLNIYLEADAQTWYFFSYSRGVMQAVSSDDKFNSIIRELKPDKKVQDVKNNGQQYQYMLSTERRKNDFLRKIVNTTEE